LQKLKPAAHNDSTRNCAYSPKSTAYSQNWRLYVSRLALIFALSTAAFASTIGVARSDPAGGQPVDGIHCERMESGVFHIHQHLALYDHGRPVPIPNDVGRPIAAECLYWIHTHTPDGLIHVESPAFRSFHLGDFFDIWGQPLSATRIGPAHVAAGQLRIYLDGHPYKGNPRKIELTAHADIVLEAGAPYVKPAPFTDWRGQ
jgi:hypothetical protein